MIKNMYPIFTGAINSKAIVVFVQSDIEKVKKKKNTN